MSRELFADGGISASTVITLTGHYLGGLAINSTHRAVLGWLYWDAAPDDAEAVSVWDPNQGWSTQTALGERGAEFPDVAVGGSGAARDFWYAFDGGAATLYFSDGGWTPEPTLATSSMFITAPTRVVMNDADQAMGFWSDITTVWATHFVGPQATGAQIVVSPAPLRYVVSSMNEAGEVVLLWVTRPNELYAMWCH
jgi:hypothetical protein